MEDKNELSDIVLEKDDGKILKVKRVLIIIAILIIIFLIVLLSMKLLNNSVDSKTPNLILPPEPTSSVEKSQKDEELFKQVPIIEENKTKKDNFNKIVKNLKDKEMVEAPLAVYNTSGEKIKTDANKQKITTNTKKKMVAKPVVSPIKKPIVKKVKSIVHKARKAKKSIKATRGIYIQAGATSKFKPNKKFLNKIVGLKFSYKLLPLDIKGKKVTKILIGPFKNRSIAKQNLAQVRKALNKHAFIYVAR